MLIKLLLDMKRNKNNLRLVATTITIFKYKKNW